MRRSPKPGAFTARTVQATLQLVYHEHGEGLALDVLSHYHEVLGHGCDLLQYGEKVGHRRYLLAREEDVRILQLSLHLRGVGDEVGRYVAPVDLHTVDVINLVAEAFRLFDRYDPIAADLVHDVGDQAAHLLVVSGQCRHSGDLVASLHRLRHGFYFFLQHRGRFLDAPLQHHGVGAGHHVLEPALQNGVRQDR